MKIGLTDKEVEISKNKYGTNEIPTPKKRTLLTLILESLADPIIKILLIALVVKIIFMMKDFNWYETLGILIAIFLATLISTLSEYGSESAFKKLQESQKNIDVKVYRNNKLIYLKSNLIVVDDLVYLESGDIVPADIKLVSGRALIDESMLTGESKLKEKKYQENKKTSLYKGTILYEGKIEGVVENVGINTMYGSIAKEVSSNKNKSPLKRRLIELSKVINKVGYIGAFLVSLSYLFSTVVIKNNFDMNLIREYVLSKNIIEDLIYTLTLCVTTIVVAVPEGLPMMITLVLSSNMKRLVKNNVLVRKMVGIEAAGNMNYLLTDKTGTITKGTLEVTSYISGDLYKYKNINEIKNNLYKEEVINSLVFNNSSTINKKDIIGGNSTDKAIIKYVKDYYNIKENIKYKLEEFNSDKKISEAFINNCHYIKGAYDQLIDKCSYIVTHNNKVEKINKKVINSYVDNYLKKGLRILINIKEENNIYYFLGLILIKDVLRNESIEGIKLIKNAGINVIMITGDHIKTATSIAKESGIISSSSDISITSEEFNNMSYDEIISKINNIKVIARALPSDKSRLVKILEENKYIVGMTGDGVNDAPALKQADVGFAMGSGTNVAKEASDIIILDNNLLSISKAVLFGRTIFKSIRKFIVYQLTVNLCALALSIIGPFIGVNTPITITQMLWLNMIMDTFAGLAFSFEPPLKKYLNEKPKNICEPVINKYMYIEILTSGLYSALICILYLKLPLVKNIINGNNKYFMTGYFALFIFLGIFNAFNSRTEKINIFKNIFSNKIFLLIFSFISVMQIIIIYSGGDIFKTYGLKIEDLIFIILMSSSIILISTIRKILIKKVKISHQ